MREKSKMAPKAGKVQTLFAPPLTSPLLHIYDQIAAKGLYAILLLVPITFLPNTYWPFDIPKVTLIRILTIIVLCAYLSRTITSREWRIIRPPLVWPVIIYVAFYALSSVFSICPDLSLHSGEGRNFGLFSLVNIIVLYFLVINIMTERHQLMNCLNMLVISSSIVSIMGIFQYYGISVYVMSPTMAYRASSTFGNPDFLFSFLVLSLPVACAYVMEKRYFYLLPLGIITFALVLSAPPLIGTIGDLLLSLAILAILIVIVYLPGKYRLRFCLITTPLVAIVICLIVVSNVGSMRDTADDFITSHIGGKDSDRTGLANIAMDSFKDYPILGSGPNTFRNTFTKHAPLEYAQARPERREDKVHNSFVEALTTTGIIGLLSYLLVLGALAWHFLRWLWRHQGNREFAIIASILVGGILYIGQSILIFHTTTPYTFFWILMALGIGITTIDSPRIKRIPLRISRTFSSYIVIMLLGVSGFGIYPSLHPLIANIHYFEATKLTNEAKQLQKFSPADANLKYQEALNKYQSAINWFGSENHYRWSYSIALLQAAADSQDINVQKQNCSKIEDLTNESLEMEPESAMLYYNRGIFEFNCGASMEDVLEDINKSIEMYPTGYMIYQLRAELHTRQGNLEKAIADDEMSLLIKPGQIDNLIRLGKNYITLGDQYNEDSNPDTIPEEQYQAAISTLKEASDLAIKANNIQQLFNLGRDFTALGDRYKWDNNAETDPQEPYQEAIGMFQKLAEINPNDATSYYSLGMTYEKAGSLEKAKESYTITAGMLEEYISANPDSVDGHFMLGFCYEGIDNLEKAKEEYQAVLDLDPDHQEAQEGLERLGEGKN